MFQPGETDGNVSGKIAGGGRLSERGQQVGSSNASVYATLRYRVQQKISPLKFFAVFFSNRLEF